MPNLKHYIREFAFTIRSDYFHVFFWTILVKKLFFLKRTLSSRKIIYTDLCHM